LNLATRKLAKPASEDGKIIPMPTAVPMPWARLARRIPGQPRIAKRYGVK